MTVTLPAHPLTPMTSSLPPTSHDSAPGTPPAWHTLPAADAERRLGSPLESGLGPDEVAARRALHGPNALPDERRRGVAAMLLGQFADFMILVLVAAAVVSGLVGDLVDTLVIVLIIVLNALLGFVQEYRAEQALAALRRMAAPRARVRRHGVTHEVAASELVPGDVVLLEAGNVVPADLRLAECASLHIAEAALTGESVPVAKVAGALQEADLPLAERHNMAYKGTVVTRGRGSGWVVATGRHTELGRIADLIARAGEGRTPLQKRLARFGTRLAWVVLAICAIVFVAGLLRGEPVVRMLLTAISLAVAAIPEALPAVVAIALALGAARMAKNKALVRRLPAVETLGSVTVICSDKTGTLTKNRMQVDAWCRDGATLLPAEPVPAPLLAALALCNDAQAGADGSLVGDPTETALLEAALRQDATLLELRDRMPRQDEQPFDAATKRMLTLHRGDDGFEVFAKGAPETLLPCCIAERGASGSQPLDAAKWERMAQTMARRGLRVLALAHARHAHHTTLPPREALHRDLTLLGLVGLLDPPRPEAAAAVAECLAAGIRPVMITGDHPATALAIAERLGLCDGDARVMTGTELSALSDAGLALAIRDTAVFARVDPAQKIRIVEALQVDGEFVAMTGDGVNDAPALKQADVGVAMGLSGTDVAREAAHLVLLDDNFATIVAAVREGRRIYDNIRKFVRYTMTSNSGEIWTIFLAPFLGLPIPLLPIHILWINLVTDGLPGLALGQERAERDLMRRPPRPPAEGIFAHGMWQHMLWVGLLMGGVCLAVQAWAMASGSPAWQTMVFTVLTLSQLGHALAVRSERESLWALGLASNPGLLGAVLLTLALQFALIYLPPLQAVFHTTALSAAELLLCLVLSCVVFVAVELEKAVRRYRD